MRLLTPKRLVLIATALSLIALLSMGASSCGDPQQEQQRNQSIKDRAATFARAERAVPLPRTTNFPLRKTLAEMTSRQDLIDHPWYVYILGQNGNTVGYYVAKTVPVNACDFLSSTEDESNGAVLAAPSLDGIFYGGSGSSSGCDAWVFLDSATNALIQIRGVDWFSSDQPLALHAAAIRVAK